MAEGFELYHIPQQSRREKLRVVIQNHHSTTGCVGDLQGCAGLGFLPLYDPSSFLSSSPNLLSCANATPSQHTKQLGSSNNVTSSLMAAASSNNSSSNASGYGIARAIIDNVGNNESLDLQSVRDSDNDHCDFLYTHQDLRFIQHHDQAFHGGDFVVYKPEPLALSLSSHNTHNGTPVGLNLQSYESTSYGGGGDFSRSALMTLAPYTGYASILKGSKFLKPAQQLLDEICDVGFGIYAEKYAVDCGLMTDPPPLESLRTSVDDPNCGGGDKRKRSRLISLLDEVYKRYKQYYQQIQAVIASFETVAGLSSAAPFANLDLKAMSKHFHCLNNAITDQLQFSAKPHDQHHINYGKEELVWSGSSDKGLYGERAVGNVGFVDPQPVWRPQRGLPKQAVTVLRAWLFDHFLHPYPTDTEKQMLAKQTGLSRNQVSNWFINARVRLWKPMVEEVHTLETTRVHKVSSCIQEQETSPLGNSFLYRDPSNRRNQDPPLKRVRNDFANDNKYNDHQIMEGNKEHMNFYDNFAGHSANRGASANRGVSLTLGLHQNNNAITFSEPFPLDADRSSERFVIGGFDAQNRQVGREIIGGQFLHDFGG